jgi:colicin import membrane protein
MSELAKIENITAVDVFKQGVAEKFVSAIEAEISDLVFDATTAKGRKEIASMAHKVAKSKVALDNLGKELVAEWKSKAALVDADRKMLRDRLDALKDKVRLPLTEWEEAEAARVAKEVLDAKIQMDHEQALKDNDLFDRIRELERKEAELKAIEDARIAAEQAEKARIEKEANEKRIAEEAAARAIEHEKQRAAAEKANQERLVAEAQAAAERAKREKEEELRIAEERRLRDLQEAEAAAKREADRKEAARLREETEARIAEEKRAANKAHQKTVNQQIVTALIKAGISEDSAKTVVVAVVKGEIPFMSVNY